ncbi:MAG: hypothetical protein U0736_12615 [Gemmataceae bacterium]
MTPPVATADAHDLLRHFNATLGVSFSAPPDLLTAAQAAIDGCRGWRMCHEEERRRGLIALVNSKLKLNKNRLQAFLDAAAKHRAFPNYHDKAELLECLDHADERRFRQWLKSTSYAFNPAAHFDPVPAARVGAASARPAPHRHGQPERRQGLPPCREADRNPPLPVPGSYVFRASRPRRCTGTSTRIATGLTHEDFTSTC